MFNGVPAEQLHQLIAASSRASSITFPLSFSNSLSSSSPSSLHHHQGNITNICPSFDDPFSTTSSQQVLQQPQQFLHSLHQHQQQHNEEKEENRNSSSLVGMNLEFQKDPVWSQDELLSLLRIRSSLENWFSELTWEHVSRRLEELGYKRSAEKCKEKFEEESRNFNNINYNKNYKTFFSDQFDDEQELYHVENPHDKVSEQNKEVLDQQPREEEEKDEENKIMDQNVEEDPRNDQTVANKSSSDHADKEKTLVEKLSKEKKKKRRKLRDKNFDKLKGFCEDIVKKMMAQQEEIHNKLLEDMVKRDEEKVAREEAWKKQEVDRINKELEIKASEQAITSDRQATLIKFLTNFSSSSSEESGVKHKVPDISTINPPTSSSLILAQNPNPTTQNLAPQNPSSNLAPTIIPKMPNSSTIALAPQNPSSPIAQANPPSHTSLTPTQNTSQKLIITSNGKDDIGKRWPRDEVLALINMRCNLCNNNGDQDKEGASVRNTPLWERISQGMLELGYKRSAKRCKEKWENINKYFRKTKDNTNKKRSLDSRTCPYFHQLSTLYNQGTLVAAAPADRPENIRSLPENHDSTLHVAQGEKNLVQVPAAFDFEF